MEQYLMTQSLLSSWAYTFNAADGYEEAAMTDFLATLRREQKEPSEAMRNGINFENLVYEIAAGKFKAEWDPTGEIEVNSGEPIGKYLYPKGYEGASKVAEIIKGGVIQVKASRVLETAGMNFLVYGILDALKAGTIYDVKYLNKSRWAVQNWRGNTSNRHSIRPIFTSFLKRTNLNILSVMVRICTLSNIPGNRSARSEILSKNLFMASRA